MAGIELSLTMEKNAREKYKAIYNYIESKGLEYDFIPQGSFLIGTAIRPFRGDKDGNYDLYNVRTQKILKISNIIAESLNIVYVGSSIVIGKETGNPELIKEGMKRIDLGGYIVAVHQIVKSSSVQEKIRREYLENRLYDKFLGENYSFLEEE